MIGNCYRFTVSGTVQGVGFRYFTAMKAKELNITGYVRNMANGEVEVVAIGSDKKLNELSDWLRKGPRLSNVSEVKMEAAIAPPFHDFRIS
ncbi:acylphosphatase [Vibrio genomosp. F10]|uniref:Acylphosphatase n=2 Tax=Vibrio genomosp. F10 TaxID=723171 RepID=A0A1B9QWW5_9VIBR|nr:acylphosphatase [Vibrio genomosp. F10]OCH74282.1 acylphosphatase [Vibrio genomosp. F10]OEE97861.1 acylphosphatase [Vibrio genomosp. F10 str. 9ZC157]OEF05133.1 acylphosphatase [Vibrio genomosp. F10 str. 9ZB36]